jgi:hypothetical protein
MVDKVEIQEEGLDIFAEFAVDDGGVWVPYAGDVEFLIARANNAKFRRRISYFYEKHRRLLDGKGEAAEAKSNEIMATVMAETILLGWKGKVKFQGQVLEYSKPNAEKLLAVAPFREWVSKMANDEHAYKIVKEEEDKENL